MVSRRGFLGGILATLTAPGIIKAENAMKIFVPKQVIIVTRGGSLTSMLGADFDGDTFGMMDYRRSQLNGHSPFMNLPPVRYPIVGTKEHSAIIQTLHDADMRLPRIHFGDLVKQLPDINKRRLFC